MSEHASKKLLQKHAQDQSRIPRLQRAITRSRSMGMPSAVLAALQQELEIQYVREGRSTRIELLPSFDEAMPQRGTLDEAKQRLSSRRLRRTASHPCDATSKTEASMHCGGLIAC